MSGQVSDEWGGTARFFWQGGYGGIYTPSQSSGRHQGNLNFVYVDGHAERKTGAWVDNEWLNPTGDPAKGAINSRSFDWAAQYR